jgi:hypothetical protein
VKLYVNGSLVTPLTTNTASGLSLGYTLTNLPPSGSSVTARLEFADTENVKQTNQWTFTITYKSLDPSNRAAGSGLSPGFNVHLVQAPSDNGLLDNSLSRAEDQLAPNSVIPRVIDTNTVAQVVNFNQFDGDAGIIPGDQIVPGLEPDVNGDDNFAVEIEAYLDLSAGTHRFGVNTDDGFKISSGASLNDKSVTPLDFHSGGPANQTFDFFVPQAGLYPFRMVWYERSGGASAEWYSIDPGTGTTNLINDPSVPNAVKAYTAVSAPVITLQSAPVVNGPYTLETSATFDTGAGTITIPIGTTGSRFYRLSAGAAQKITTARISGGKLVLNYQAQN